MKATHIFYWLVSIELLPLSYGLQDQPATELVIKVQNPDGSPAAGIKVQQVQLERSSPFPRNLVCGVTDGEGRLTVKYLPMRSQGDDRNGYGVYRYVLMPPGYRWELSDIYYWNKEPWTELVLAETDIWSREAYLEMMRSPESARNNWSIGNLIRVAAGEQARWTVTLQPGRDVQVSVADQFSQPLARKSFTIVLDTGVLSHTGFGGEIPVSKVQTDEQGQFTLPCAGVFWYSFACDCSTRDAMSCEYCAPDVQDFTQVVKARFDGPAGSLAYYKRVPRAVTIIVRDKATQRGIPGAAISAIMQFPAALQGGTIGSTDAEGRFTTDKLFTEHLVELMARKEGYKDYKFDMRTFEPGSTCYFDLEANRTPE